LILKKKTRDNRRHEEPIIYLNSFRIIASLKMVFSRQQMKMINIFRGSLYNIDN
jgi:hypothetical protein